MSTSQAPKLVQDTASERDPTSRPNALSARTPTLTPAQLDERQIVHFSVNSRPIVDAFREIRTRLLAASNDNFVTLVAPVSRGCGGSFVARNLAVSVTFDNSKSALLVDCNLHNPSQHALMRIAPSNGGLVNYLENHREDIGSVLYDTGIPGLQLIPAGTSRHGDNEAEYFSSARMRLLIDSLRNHDLARYLFLDSPPVLGAPDARILADLADVVVLVAGYGHDTPEAIASAASHFDQRKFAGVVFNEGV
ncbi:CpsD/CapB family tyrosine-protein kinase [Aerolutibacter ruishenii]|uniref:Mrp family chromosome partitioning ATPase n=1 Tax=Aerolutibacter ruishenii TaxID=686800 RepID=A0A562LXU9_9GAMM|nr:CpsD/CapB family tyrosine-protein kinase [Lysobacter ruishenii]TWI12471.1 Mrp family chromosome partitioning ATPase [Lysobacter ruishenii]